MSIRILIIFLLASVSDLSHALYGARPVTGNRLSGVVSLIFDDPAHINFKGQICNAVLIAPTKVLTAAHCIAEVGFKIYESENPETLITYPYFLKIKVNGISRTATRVTIAPNYFEEAGAAGEDLAIVEFDKSITGIKPFPVFNKSELKPGMNVHLVANGLIASTVLKNVTRYPMTTTLTTDGSRAGVCLGDSGGAMLVEKNGTYYLAGILMVNVRSSCEKKNTLGYFPKLSF